MNGLTLGVSVTLCINKRKVPSGSLCYLQRPWVVGTWGWICLQNWEPRDAEDGNPHEQAQTNVCELNDWMRSWERRDLDGKWWKLDLRLFRISWKTAFNMEGLCDLLYPQTGAGNYRDIPVFQQVRLTVCCRDGELAPRKTWGFFSQGMAREDLLWDSGLCSVTQGRFEVVGLRSGRDDGREQVWWGILADGTRRWMG